MKWAYKSHKMNNEANFETHKDGSTSNRLRRLRYCLFRTEHMFFDPKRFVSIKKMILADTNEEKGAFLNGLFPY